MVRFIKAIPLLLVIILLAGIASVASAQSQECEAGSAVTDVANNPGLLADCDVLLAARDTLQGDATLNWSADLSIDRWDGVGLGGSPPGVTSLQFYGWHDQRLTGTIPAELGSLTNLQSLDLSDNYLTGPIPAELGSLTNLQSLTLYDNYLTGPIPAELGGLASLFSLDLSDNYLTGPIPAELGGLSSLSELRLSGNQLSGTIPSWLGNLSSLSELSLSWNQLSGTIPAELGSLTNLEWLGLSENQLSGTIPAELGSLTNLVWLHLSGNQLSGTIPAELGSLTNLEWLGLSGNQLSGTIPSWLGSLSSLSELSLSWNQLSGTIPAELGSLSSLSELSLSWNQLSGTIPAELGSLTNLVWLHLSENQLSGTIPAELGSLTNLVWLHLSGNQLSGTIPAELGSLTNLERLGLSGNQLSGTIPAELGSLSSLSELRLSGNQLSGTIPSWLGSLSSLSELRLSGNQLSGTIPAELGSLANLRWLELSGNQLTGCIPHGLRIVKGLDGLSLDFCPDPGTPTTTPPPLGDCTTGGAVTDAAANPGLVADCTALLAARDTLAGTAALNWSADLAIDSWDGVSTTGTPPRVTSLNFYGQRLTGEIPEQLGSLTYLKNLRLSYHLLSGPIPAELGSLTYLKDLDLADNRLSGPIPAELGSLTNLVWLDLSGNQLSGPIPAELGSLVNLKSLVLFGNRLTGCIPAELEAVAVTDGPLPFCTSGSGDPLPDSPTGLTTVVSDTAPRVELSWTAPNFTGGAPITGYLVQSSTDGSEPWMEVITTTGNATSYTDDGTDANGPKFVHGEWPHYRVAAVNRAGTGPFSDPVPAGGDLPVAQPEPTDRAALVALYNATDGANWTNGTNWLSDRPLGEWNGVTTDANGWVTELHLTSNQLSGSIPSQLGNLSNLQGLYLSSNQLTGVLPSGFTQLTSLERFAFGDNAGLCAPTDAAFQNWLTAIPNEYLPAGVTPLGPNCASTSTSEAPTISALTSGADFLTVTWAAPSGTGGTVITSYDLRYIESSAVDKAEANWTVVEDAWTTGSLIYTIESLTGGAQYDVQIRAVTSVGAGPWSATSSGATQATPGAPAIGLLTPGDSALTVEWSAPATDGGSDVTGYDLRYIRSAAPDRADANWTVRSGIWNSGGLRYDLEGLTNGVAYEVQVRAVNVSGTGPWSETLTGTPATWWAIRSLSPESVEAGGEVEVMITAAGYAALGGQVVETLPDGFSYAGSDLNEEAVAAADQKVTFTLFGTGPTAFKYTVTASSEEGTYSFSGVLRNEDSEEQPIGGASTIVVTTDTAPEFPAAETGERSVLESAPESAIVGDPVAATDAGSEPLTYTLGGEDAALFAIDASTGQIRVGAGTTLDPDIRDTYTVVVTATGASGVSADITVSIMVVGLLTQYDSDEDGAIGKHEAIAAVRDYFGGNLTKEQTIAVIRLYFASGS